MAHVCNDRGGWGRGFVLALSARWPGPEAAYRAWHRERSHDGVPFALGEVQFCRVRPDVVVANMVAQRGLRGRSRGIPLQYDALERCLGAVASWCLAHPAPVSVHMPRIGCGLAGGRWEVVGPIVAAALDGIPVTVYDR